MNRRAFLSAAAACSVLSASQQGARAQSPPRFYEAARYSSERGGATFLIARHGVVLAEDYPGGPPDARWPIGAGARIFTPLLAGSLIEDGLMSLDEPVSATLGDWAVHPQKSLISLRALLNGTSGVSFRRGGQRDLATALALEPEAMTGVRFASDAAAYLLFAEIARRKLEASGRESDPARYLTERTLLPIGCVPIGWTRSREGVARWDEGAAVSARGWAQAGELIRREGVWRARQLTDANAMRETLRGSFAEPRAGMGVWLAAQGSGEALDIASLWDSDLWRAASPAPADLAMAAGAGGQRLYIVPSHALVIVRQAQGEGGRWSDAQFLSLVWRDL